jgi:hypothetical protein
MLNQLQKLKQRSNKRVEISYVLLTRACVRACVRVCVCVCVICHATDI